MNTQKLVLASFLSFAVMFFISFFWHAFLMNDFYAENPPVIDLMHGDYSMIQYVMIGYAVLAVLMAYIYPKGMGKKHFVGQGIRFGILIGLIWTLPLGLVNYGGSLDHSMISTMVDTVWHVFEQGMGGLVISLVYGNINTD